MEFRSHFPRQRLKSDKTVPEGAGIKRVRSLG